MLSTSALHSIFQKAKKGCTAGALLPVSNANEPYNAKRKIWATSVWNYQIQSGVSMCEEGEVFSENDCEIRCWHVVVLTCLDTQNASAISKAWCMWDFSFQRYHMIKIVQPRFLLATVGHQWEYCFSVISFSCTFSCSASAETRRPAPSMAESRRRSDFFFKSKEFSITIWSLILDPWRNLWRSANAW